MEDFSKLVPALDVDNYASWSVRMKAVLISKGLLIEYRQGKHFSTQATSRTKSFKLLVCSKFRLKVIA